MHFCNYHPRKVSRGSKLHNRYTTTQPRPPNATQNKYRIVVRNTSRTACDVGGHPPAAGSVAPALFPSPARPLRGMRSPRRARPLAFSLRRAHTSPPPCPPAPCVGLALGGCALRSSVPPRASRAALTAHLVAAPRGTHPPWGGVFPHAARRRGRHLAARGM